MDINTDSNRDRDGLFPIQKSGKQHDVITLLSELLNKNYSNMTIEQESAVLEHFDLKELEEGLRLLKFCHKLSQKLALFCVNKVVFDKQAPKITALDLSHLYDLGLLSSIDVTETNLRNFNSFPNRKALYSALSLLSGLDLPAKLLQAYVYLTCYQDLSEVLFFKEDIYHNDEKPLPIIINLLAQIARAPIGSTIVKVSRTLNYLLYDYDMYYFAKLLKMIFSHDIDKLNDIFIKIHEIHGGEIFYCANPPFIKNMLLYVNGLVNLSASQSVTKDIIYLLLRTERYVSTSHEQASKNLLLLSSYSNKEKLYEALTKLVTLMPSISSKQDVMNARLLHGCIAKILLEQYNPEKLLDALFSLKQAKVRLTNTLVHEVISHPHKEQLHLMLNLMSDFSISLAAIEQENNDRQAFIQKVVIDKWTASNCRKCMVAMIKNETYISGTSTLVGRFMTMLRQLHMSTTYEVNSLLSPETVSAYLEAKDLLDSMQKKGAIVIWLAIRCKVIAHITQKNPADLAQFSEAHIKPLFSFKETALIDIIDAYGKSCGAIHSYDLNLQLCKSKGYQDYQHQQNSPNRLSSFFPSIIPAQMRGKQEKGETNSCLLRRVDSVNS